MLKMKMQDISKHFASIFTPLNMFRKTFKMFFLKMTKTSIPEDSIYVKKFLCNAGSVNSTHTGP